MDGQTDRWTDGRAIAYSALSMLSRANKNEVSFAIGVWGRAAAASNFWTFYSQFLFDFTRVLVHF